MPSSSTKKNQNKKSKKMGDVKELYSYFEALLAELEEDPSDTFVEMKEKLMLNKRNDRVIRVDDVGFLIDGKDIYKGILPFLFGPKKTEDDYFAYLSKKRKRSSYVPSTMKKDRRCMLHGKDHGSIVHANCSTFVNSLVNHLPIKLPMMDPCAYALLNYLKERQWLPLMNEYMIWNEDREVATAIDMIALDLEQDESVLIELKTGYEDSAYEPQKSDPHFTYPFEEFRDCNLNRHVLQILGASFILQAKYDFKADQEVVLLRQPRLKNTVPYEVDSRISSTLYKKIYPLWFTTTTTKSPYF